VSVASESCPSSPFSALATSRDSPFQHRLVDGSVTPIAGHSVIVRIVGGLAAPDLPGPTCALVELAGVLSRSLGVEMRPAAVLERLDESTARDMVQVNF